jgi:hypothetical protein
MTRSHRTLLAMATAGFYIASQASISHAIAAVYASYPTGCVEVQGFGGRFPIPTTVQPSGSSYTGVLADVGTDSVLYQLVPQTTGAVTGIIINENDTHSGAYLGSIQLAASVNGIAYSDGQLFGIRSIAGPQNTQSFNILSIAANGSTQSLITQSTSVTNAPTWHINGAVNGDSLLVTPLVNSTQTPAYTFTPSTPSLSPVLSSLVGEAGIHADGQP